MRGLLDFASSIKITDLRIYQVIFLASFLTIGVAKEFIDLSLYFLFWVPVVGVVTHYLLILLKNVTSGARLIHLRGALLSSFITFFSVMLLLRSAHLKDYFICLALALFSKAFIHFKGRHLFNPANFGIIVSLICLDSVWVTAGQWGHENFWIFSFLCLGLYLAFRKARSNSGLMFLLMYFIGLFLRMVWLGDEWLPTVHKIGQGSLLVFSFFMISDPKTSPHTFGGRLIHCSLIAVATLTMQFVFYWNNAPLIALFLIGPLFPLWDRFFLKRQFEYSSA